MGTDTVQANSYGQCGTCLPTEGKRIVALFGIRLWDPVVNAPVNDEDIALMCWPEKGGRPVRALRTPSGIYAFNGLPGFQNFEYPAGDFGPKSVTKRFIAKARDNRNRFMPMAFWVDIPAPLGVLYDRRLLGQPTSAAPLGDPRGLLFSQPARPIPPGIAVIRAQLKEYSSGLAVSHAVMEVEIAGKQWYGISDTKGSIAILFPYPAPESSSPPQSVSIPLEKEKWNLTVRVRYQPEKIVYFPDEEFRDTGRTEEKLPELQSIFDQSAAAIWATMPGSPVLEPAAPSFSAELNYGKGLVLQTGRVDSPYRESELYIDM
jgi:hypothetical protein